MSAPCVALTREDLADFAQAAEREWLVTNGIGGYASGTVAGACTRRYHGWLVAALKPPVERRVLIAKCETEIEYRGQRYALGSNEYADGTIAPQGYVHLDSFTLEGQLPVWTWAIADLRLEQRLWMVQGRNTSICSLTVLEAAAAVTIRLRPFCTYRDYHALARGSWDIAVEADEQGCAITAYEGAARYRVTAEHADFRHAPSWHWQLAHRAEAARGLDAIEDVFVPGEFSTEIVAGQHMSVCFSIDAPLAAESTLRCEQARQNKLAVHLGAAAPDWIRQLACAADQFLVGRGVDLGATVIAGYPWFTDWGRDTMIALPGLMHATARFDVIARILRTFAGHVSEGMLPNRFPDDGAAPEYNTVDATLWLFDAVQEYLAASGDLDLAAALWPTLKDIVAWHERGTRYDIKIDPQDGLLHAGVAGVQLTWMDAKVGAQVITPRIGKAVEINALWQHALRVMVGLAERLDDTTLARDYRARADAHAEQFNRRFWYAAGGYLYDVIDTPDGQDDASLRPNQIFAVALGDQLLAAPQRRAVVDVCLRELWTPFGLRSLSPGDAAYCGRYAGSPHQRDAVYHQGTAWSWLLGPMARAHRRVYGDPAAALALLTPLAGHLRHTGLGSISEIFDGDAPHAARGCIAQAWSVATVLHAWCLLSNAAPSPIYSEVRS